MIFIVFLFWYCEAHRGRLLIIIKLTLTVCIGLEKAITTHERSRVIQLVKYKDIHYLFRTHDKVKHLSVLSV
jgi:hypothetical protein